MRVPFIFYDIGHTSVNSYVALFRQEFNFRAATYPVGHTVAIIKLERVTVTYPVGQLVDGATEYAHIGINAIINAIFFIFPPQLVRD